MCVHDDAVLEYLKTADGDVSEDTFRKGDALLYVHVLKGCRTFCEVVAPDECREIIGKWRLVSIDGSTLEVADEKGNNEAFGRPGASRGESAYPQIRFVSLVENGTHVLFGSRMADYATSEIALAKTVLPSLRQGHVVSGGPRLFRVRDVEAGGGHWCGPSVARQKEHSVALEHRAGG